MTFCFPAAVGYFTVGPIWVERALGVWVECAFVNVDAGGCDGIEGGSCRTLRAHCSVGMVEETRGERVALQGGALGLAGRRRRGRAR